MRSIVFLLFVVGSALGRPEYHVYQGYHGFQGNHLQQLFQPQTYQGPQAPLASDGRVIDTQEVAAAKAAHAAAYAAAAARSHYAPAYHDAALIGGHEGFQAFQNFQTYSGPPAPIGQDGKVVDTPEVNQAKAAHFAAHAEALSRHPIHLHGFW